MKFVRFTVFFFVCCFCFGQNQQKLDSLIMVLKKTGELQEKAVLENQLSLEYIKIRNLKKADSIAKKALLKGIQIKTPVIIADAYLNIANIHYINWEGPEAINYYQKVDSILSKSKILNSTLCKSKYNIGKLILRTDYDSLGLSTIKRYYKESYDIALALKDSVLQAAITISLGDLHLNKSENDEALINYKIAEKLIKKDDKKSLANLYWALAEVYFKEKDKVKSRNYIYKRFDLVKNSKDINSKAYANWVHGNLLFMIEDYKDAIKHLKRSILLFETLEFKDFGRLAGAGDRMYKSYEAIGDYKQALYYLKKTMIYNDSGLAKTKSNKVLELETKYQTEKKEKEIALLKSEKELTEQKQKSERNLLIGGLGLTTLAGLFLFVLYRNRQKTNTKLKELDTAKSNFFANISHEFRTPLTLISNPIDQAIEDTSLSGKKRAQFVMAKRNSDRLLSLVNQLLDLSKIDAGQLKLHIQKGNIHNLISGLAESFNYSAKQKAITYNLNIEKNNKYVWFDKDALEKITVNLLSNAIKYTPENGSVYFESSIEKDTLFISVKNTGVALTKNEIDNIFVRFYQTEEQNQGTGIGLALVKELVELHKGHIKVDSDTKNWIRFLVSMPVDEKSFKNEVFIDSNEEKSIIKTTHNNVSQDIDDDFEDNNKPILLVVEDNDDVRILLKQTFDVDYNILTAKNGQIGVDLALEHVPDIIISDIMMPIKDGIALTNTLKNSELTSHIPIILLTAKAGDENEIKGIEIGADDYITKPFNSKLLKTKVSNLIGIRQKLQNRYSQEIILTPKDIAVTNLDEQFLKKVQKVLETNLIESSFNVEVFSKALGMSRMQLHRKIKALTGLSASGFVRSQRLKLAAELLKTSDINISQVGYSVGFNDHSYFTKCFKELYHCTPTEFANKSTNT